MPYNFNIKNQNKGIEMIEVQKYNPQWSNRFQSLSSQFLPHIKDLTLDVVHVGGTSIKGMSSHPTIDINIVVDDFSTIQKISEKLRLVGYYPENNEVQKDQFVFKHNKSVAHSLQIVQKDSLNLKMQLLLKKHLEENSTALNEYDTLKNKFASGKISLDKYQAAEKKLIECYLSAEGMTEEEISQIL